MLLDLEAYRIINQLEGHVGRVFSARFEVGQIFTAGADGTARRWDGTSGKLLQTYHGSSRFLADATLTPDGSMVVAGGGDGMLRFWDTATAYPLWTLPAHKSHLIGLHFEGAAIVTRGFSGDLARWVLPRSEVVIKACRDCEAELSWRNEEAHPQEAPR
jgi:WD40 repeat protein